MSEKKAFNVDKTDLTGWACPRHIEPVIWEFACCQCQHIFTTPVPRGPKEEKQLKCPLCASSRIKRTTVDSIEPVFCGG